MTRSLSEDQKHVEQLLQELTDIVVREYAPDIDFLILFGSAARGEFIKGVSDIDLVIQLKKGEGADEIERFANRAFWELNEKYQLEFEKVLTTAPRARGFLRDIEHTTNLYTPIFVFRPGDINWGEGRLKRPLLKALGAGLLVSQSTTFLKFKTEGRVLWGRDIRSEINPQLTFWERWKGIWLPQYLSIAAVVLALFAPEKAGKYATKAILWELDAALLYLEKFPEKQKERPEQLTKELDLDRTIKIVNDFITLSLRARFSLFPQKRFRIVQEAIRKRKMRDFSGGALHNLWFALRSAWFVASLNTAVFLKYIERMLLQRGK